MRGTSQISKQIGENIRRIRSHKQISQEELAFLANLHRAYIGKVERAELNISITNLFKIAQGLEVEIQKLLVM